MSFVALLAFMILFLYAIFCAIADIVKSMKRAHYRKQRRKYLKSLKEGNSVSKKKKPSYYDFSEFYDDDDFSNNKRLYDFMSDSEDEQERFMHQMNQQQFEQFINQMNQ